MGGPEKETFLSAEKFQARVVLNESICFWLFQVRWYRDTMLLDQNENRMMQAYGFRHSLLIHRAKQSDFGNYSCAAENELGRSRAFIEVSGEYTR